METEAATAPQLAALADTDINWDKHIIRSDGIPGIFRGFGTSAMGSLPEITQIWQGYSVKVIDDYGVGKPSVLKTTKMLLREDGWKGFYRGFGPRFLNMSFYGTTMIVTYDIIRS
ncbi:hypothetical protein KY285_001144 [Solanum tuberosum]|nr:hypothetical protein KY285_001144 [Solanum tuberosum]